MLATGAQRLVSLYGVRPGTIVVVATSNDQGYYAALDLLDAGVRVAAVVDLRSTHTLGSDIVGSLWASNVEILTGHAVVRAEGKSRVNAAVVSPLANGRPAGAQRRLACDLLCMSGGFRPADPLLHQSGCQFSYNEGLEESVPDQLAAGIHVAGDVAGYRGLPVSLLQGTVAGNQAAGALRGRGDDTRNTEEMLQRDLTLAEEEVRKSAQEVPRLTPMGGEKSQFVCFCEDVTAKDIVDGINEGFEDIQTLKRYSTVTMAHAKVRCA